MIELAIFLTGGATLVAFGAAFIAMGRLDEQREQIRALSVALDDMARIAQGEMKRLDALEDRADGTGLAVSVLSERLDAITLAPASFERDLDALSGTAGP